MFKFFEWTEEYNSFVNFEASSTTWSPQKSSNFTSSILPVFKFQALIKLPLTIPKSICAIVPTHQNTQPNPTQPPKKYHTPNQHHHQQNNQNTTQHPQHNTTQHHQQNRQGQLLPHTQHHRTITTTQHHQQNRQGQLLPHTQHHRTITTTRTSTRP